MGVLRTWRMIFIKLVCVLCFVNAYDPSTCIQCRKSHVCNPPDCFCCRDTMPLETNSIPQMVFFTFDDAVNPQVAKHYKDLFDSSRLNPNGCPIHMTLFISHQSTVYSYVREFYEKGMEIASHSVTHSHPNSHTFLREAKKQKENLARKANIPESEIVGWRSPFLEPLGDTQPTVLKELGYKYDATLTITKKGSNDKAITPFTLDHGWPYDCKIKPCPTKPHNGFWEVPVVSVKDYKNKYDCVYIDACHSPPPSENTAYQFLWDNFQRYYSTNRAPMGINMHASWFYYPDRKAAMDKFIKQLVKMDDVYILTVKQVIEWLKDPTPLNQIKTFKPWLCNSGNKTIGVTDFKPIITDRKQINQDIQTQRRFTPKQMQTMQTNAPTQASRWQVQRQSRMKTSAFNRQSVRPTAAPYPTSTGIQGPVWGQPNMNSMSPIPIPPMSPNFPNVRFWWRPPTVVNPRMQIMKRREAIQRQRVMQEQQRQESLRQEMREKHRQNMILQKRAEEEKLRKEQLEKQRQEEIKRQQLLKKKQLEMKMLEEKKRQERLRQEQIEKQKQEELKRKELIKQKLIEQQRLEEKVRQERIAQEQIVIQKQEQLRKEQERQMLEEKMRQKSIQQQEELRMQEQLKQLEQQRLEEQQRNAKLEKQKQDEINRQGLVQKQQIVTQTSEAQAYKQKDVTSINRYQNSQPNENAVLSNKLDAILTHSKNDRISMLQGMSLFELQLLQYEVNRRMAKVPESTKPDNPLLTMKKNVKNDVKGVVMEKTVAQDNYQSAILGIDTKEISNALSPQPAQDIAAVAELITETTTQRIQTTTMDVTTGSTTIETTTIDIKPIPEQKTASVAGQELGGQQIIVTEKPTSKVFQETIPIQYGTTTTTAPVNNFEKEFRKVNDFPFFNFLTPKLSLFEQQSLDNSPVKAKKVERTPVWHTGAFDINSLSGPWKREPIQRTPKPTPEITTKMPVRKTSLKLLPVAVTLFNTNNIQPKHLLSYKAFVRPNLFAPGKPSNTDIFSDEAVPVLQSKRHTPVIQKQEKPFEFPKPVNLLPTELFGKAQILPTAKPTIPTTPSTTTSTTTTTPIPTTTTTVTTTTTTTTVPPPTTTTTTTTTTPTTTTVASNTPKQAYRRPTKLVSSMPQAVVTQPRAFRTLVPIMPDWRLDGPIAIPPYRSSFSLAGMNKLKTNKAAVGCKQGENCDLPNCFCKTESVPMKMNVTEVPQIVYITIDGSLNFHSLSKIRKLFARRRNPNGCKVKGTLFITDAGSSYRISNVLLNDGLELAMMGMNSRPYTNKEYLKSDILLQRQRIAESSNLPQNSIQGWRSPGFKTFGDDHFSFMNNHSLYDSSVMLDKSSSSEPKLWPFTLDFGLNERCAILPCPNKRHPGMWEVPVIPYLGADNSTTCEYVDSCTKQPKNAENTFNFLMNNFNMYYKTNRAPFAIRLKQIWFHWYYRENLKGLFRFLDTVTGYGDVYISSISDMLKWIKKPVKLQNIDMFKPWKCKRN